MLSTTEKLRRGLLKASVWLYLSSFALPAYVTTSGSTQQAHYGIEAFLLGPIGVFAGHLSWMANVLLWHSWRSHGSGNSMKPFVLALLAAGTASTFLLYPTIAVGSAGEYRFYASVGFYAWLASTVLAAISGWNDSDIPAENEVPS